MSYHYWQYYLALERSFDKTTQYVELHANNNATYSIEFARILLSSCSEIDVICKLLCKRINSIGKFENINDYKATITGQYPNFYSTEVIVLKNATKLSPWQDWSTPDNPGWWRSYNNVKHERDSAYQEANLENTLNALCGLYCLILYFYQPELYDLKLEPSSIIFSLEEAPANLVDGVYKLPDF